MALSLLRLSPALAFSSPRPATMLRLPEALPPSLPDMTSPAPAHSATALYPPCASERLPRSQALPESTFSSPRRSAMAALQTSLRPSELPDVTSPLQMASHLAAAFYSGCTSLRRSMQSQSRLESMMLLASAPALSWLRRSAPLTPSQLPDVNSPPQAASPSAAVFYLDCVSPERAQPQATSSATPSAQGALQARSFRARAHSATPMA